MNRTPLHRSELPDFAGRMVQAESPMFDLLPQGSTIVVAGDGEPKPTSYEKNCFLCQSWVWMDRRDDPDLQNEPLLCILCPECYFKMEPQRPA